MSVVVVVKKNGKAVIASDSLSTFSGTKILQKYQNAKKIISFNDSYVGVTGASAHLNVLKNLFSEYSEHIDLSSRENIFRSYLKIHPILKDEYYINTSEDNDNIYESSQIDALIANPNGIFGMYSWRETNEYTRYWAIGSGSELALGAMFAAYELFDEPEKIAEIGVNAACEFDDGCSLPMDIYSVELESNE